MRTHFLARVLVVLAATPLLSLSLTESPQADANLQRVGAWPYGPSYAVDVDPIRNLIFLSSGGVVLTLDGTDPTDPQFLNDDIHTLGLIEDLFYDVDDQNLYIAGGDGGLEIWDVDDPLHPVRLSATEVYYYDVETPVESVEVYGNYAITENSWGYVHSLDVSDPTNPIQVGFNGTMGNPALEIHVSQEDGQVHATGYGGFVRLAIQPDGALQSNGGRDFTYGAVFGTPSIAYVSSSGHLTLLDLYDPLFRPWATIDANGITDLVVRDGYAYIINRNDGLRIIDVSVPSSPKHVSVLPFGVWPRDIALSGDHAYVPVGVQGLLVIDVSDAENPAIVGSYEDVPSLTWQTEIVGNHAYLANSSSGLTILDLTDLVRPVAVGNASTESDETRDVAYDNGLVYTADGMEGVRILDVSDPTTPVEIGSIGGLIYGWRLLIAGSFLYVINSSSGLYVVDVSDPANPVEVGSVQLQTGSSMWELARAGDYLYVAGDDGGVRIVDISQPTSPVEVGSYSLPWVTDVAVQDELLYVASFHPFLGGLFIMDITNPESPQVVGAYNPDWFGAFHLDVIGDYIYVCDGDELYLIDATDPTDPTRIETYTTPGLLAEITAHDQYIFVSDGEAGVQVLENLLYEGPSGIEDGAQPAGAALRLEPALPNPFSIAATIRYLLPRPGRVELGIYEPSGRLVRTLLDRVEPAGAGSILWDGRNDAGSKVGTGVYLYRLGFDGERRAGRIVRIR